MDVEMTYKLFLDDYRHPKFLDEKGYSYNPKGKWVIARSYAEAINVVEAMGVPLFVAFDHDLEDAHYDGKEGHERTGLTFADWLTDYLDNNNVELDDEFDWCVHSMNPVGAERIRVHMHQWYKRYYERINR
jgi:hypothetical protein